MKSLTQFYSVDKVVMRPQSGRGKTIHFDDLACQMLVHGPQQASFVVTNPSRALDGVLQWQWPGLLKSIEYTIVGSPDGERVGMQRYKHDFTTEVTVDRLGVVTARQGALFIPYQIDVLLDTKEFGRVQSIQFIA
jgi:hypothetical protein